jgi:protein-disulfide isomerase
VEGQGLASTGIATAGGTGVLGSADALVTVVEFTDFQCPYCRRYALQTLPRILETYVDSGQVRYVVKDFPLPSHPRAWKAAEAARCAGAQGAYWGIYRRLFETQNEWSQQGPDDVIETFVGDAEALGLDTASFQECLESGQYSEQVAQDVQDGQQAGVEGTPTFLINDRLLAGAYTFETFRRIIDGKLSE